MKLFKKIAAMTVMAMCVAFCCVFTLAKSTSNPTRCYHPLYVTEERITYRFKSATECEKTVYQKGYCFNCDRDEERTTTTIQSHDIKLSRADCDGSKQHWYYACDNCFWLKEIKEIACPNGPHSPGVCSMLPVSYDHDVEK